MRSAGPPPPRRLTELAAGWQSLQARRAAGGNERENLNFTSAGRLHGCRVVGWLNDWIVGSKSMASASSSLARGPR